jgi:hypothetical protein
MSIDVAFPSIIYAHLGNTARVVQEIARHLRGVPMRLTVELQVKAREKYGVCVNEACDRCGKLLAEVRWTRRDQPETYCSKMCRDNKPVGPANCLHCKLPLPSDHSPLSRYCDRTCRQDAYMLRKAGQDFSKNPISRQLDRDLQGFLISRTAVKHGEAGNARDAVKTGAN